MQRTHGVASGSRQRQIGPRYEPAEPIGKERGDMNQGRKWIECTLNSGRRPSAIRMMLGIASALLAQSVVGFEFDTGDPDLKVNWDNTVRYTLADRVKGQSTNLIVGPV